MPCRITQDGWVTVKSSDKHGPQEEEMATCSVLLAREYMDSDKRLKDTTPKDEPPRSERCPYANGEECPGNY